MQLRNKIYYVGVQDPKLKVFDIIMETEFGTTYNAYLIKGEKIALIETAHEKLTDRYIKNIEEICDIKEISYVIMNHTEPDHSGSIEALLERNPDIEVIATAPALKNIKNMLNREFKQCVAKDGDSLDLGGGAVLEFYYTPNLHWPDTMITWFPAEKTLFSCDILGAHYCNSTVTDDVLDSVENYEKAFKFYFECIVEPFKGYIGIFADKIKDMQLEMVCTSHGPVLKRNIKQAIDKYMAWKEPVKNERKTVAIYYVSAYGYTEKMMKLIKSELEARDILVYSYNVIEADVTKMQKMLKTADGLLFGSPTINRNALKPIWDMISCIDLVNIKKTPVGVFGSYGWSGEACRLLEQHLKLLNINVPVAAVRTALNPSDDDVTKIKAFADAFAENV